MKISVFFLCGVAESIAERRRLPVFMPLPPLGGAEALCF